MEINYTQNQISEVASQLLAAAPSSIFLFYGEMGVGKTTLIKEMVKQLGASETSSSPSFSIVNEYEIEKGPIFHFDFYRIKSIEEAFDIGLEEYLYHGAFIFMEWPEKIAPLLPPNANTIYIEKNQNGSRTLNLKPMS
jgi:tRNA threonylcarbamoyladenosine biosynthesis protein TsaE